MKKTLTYLAFALIISLGTVAYFYHATSAPRGHFVDTIVNVVNGICIRHTGADEYGNVLPWYFRAFDDYRPPILIYMFAITDFITPMNLDKARIIAMLLGFAAISFIMLFIWRSGFFERARFPLAYAFFFAFLLTSSWVMLPHRTPGEFVLAQFFVAGLMATTLWLIKHPSSIKLGFINGLFTASMLYAYYGTKTFYFMQIPLLLLVLLKREKISTFIKNNRGAVVAVVVALLLGIPTFHDLLGQKRTMQRFHTVSSGVSIPGIIQNYVSHVNLNMFFFNGDKNPRHHTQYKGQFNQFFFPFYVMGLLVALHETIRRRNRYWMYIVLFFAGSFVPVSLTNEGLPHSLRTISSLIPMIFIMFLGYIEIEKLVLQTSHARRKLAMSAVGILFVFGAFEAYNNFWYYHNETSKLDHVLWSHFPEYHPPKEMTPFTNHMMSTVSERYYRMVHDGELRYCDFVLNPRESIFHSF